MTQARWLCYDFMYWKYVNHMSKHSEEESTFSVHFTEKFRQAERNRWRKMEDGFGVGWLSREVRSWRDRPLQRANRSGNAGYPVFSDFSVFEKLEIFFYQGHKSCRHTMLAQGWQHDFMTCTAMRIKAWRKPCDIRIAGRIAGVQGTEQSEDKKMLKSSIALRECESTEQSEGKKCWSRHTVLAQTHNYLKAKGEENMDKP